MRILLVNKYLFPKGGDAVATLQTYDLLKAMGHEVFVWGMAHPSNPEYPLSAYFVSNIDYDARLSLRGQIALAMKVWYSFEAKKKMERVLDLVKPDIVHLNNFAHQISPSILDPIKRRHVPIVMTMHDFKLVCPVYSLTRIGRPCELCRRKRFFYCTLFGCMKGSYLKSAVNTIEMYLHHSLLHIYDAIDCFISPSVFLKDKLHDMGFRGRVVHMPNFVDTRRFSSIQRITGEKVIYAGRLEPEKGLFTLVEAMRGTNLRLDITGDGSARKTLERLVFDYGPGVNIRFPGHVSREELVSSYSGALFAICPSECYEILPFAVIEAFAMGLPVIGARIGGIPELVKDGVTGLTFTPGDSADLRNKIMYLTSHPDFIRKMGENARLLVEERYTKENHYQNLIGIYEKEIRKSRIIH